jgi:hypothetical protein
MGECSLLAMIAPQLNIVSSFEAGKVLYSKQNTGSSYTIYFRIVGRILANEIPAYG